MNRAQQGALMSLSAFVLSAAVFGYLLVRILVLQSLPRSLLGRLWPVLAFAALVAWWIVLLRRRQSPAEPEADERDTLIMRRAAQIAFVATWVLLAAVTLVLGLALGQTATIPVYVLTFIHLGLFVAAMAIYFVATLVLYGRGGDDHE
jgi:L-asparagine transporter-like permease